MIRRNQTVALSALPRRIPRDAQLLGCTITGTAIIRVEVGAWFQRNRHAPPAIPLPPGTPVYLIESGALVMGCTFVDPVEVELPAGVSASFLPPDWDDPEHIIVPDEPEEE